MPEVPSARPGPSALIWEGSIPSSTRVSLDFWVPTYSNRVRAATTFRDFTTPVRSVTGPWVERPPPG